MQNQILEVLETVLKLEGRSADFTAETKLLGALPELDSLALTSLLAAIEKKFKIFIEDDEIDRSVFKTVGSLTQFVEKKVGAKQ